MLNKSPVSRITVMEHFDKLKYALLEGELVTIGGYLAYNSNEDEFQISNLFIVVAGQAKSFFEKGVKEYLKY